jgi:hypothetical protein
MQSERICKRAPDALVVGAPRLQTLPESGFAVIDRSQAQLTFEA